MLDTASVWRLASRHRPGEPRTVPVWRRRRLEAGWNGKPRHRLRQPLKADGRIHCEL